MSQAEHPHPLVLTIATRGFLDRIAVLADSLKKHHPDVRLRCYLIESDATDADTCGDRFDVVPVGDLDLPARDHFLFQYTPFELCCALKPYCLLHALDGGAERALFLDGDMFVAQPFLTDLDAEWMNGILATPHLRTPDVETDFVYFLRTGHFNAGFLGARNTPEARSLLSWGAERVEKHCYRDYYGGILEDQRWLDMPLPCSMAPMSCVTSASMWRTGISMSANSPRTVSASWRHRAHHYASSTSAPFNTPVSPGMRWLAPIFPNQL